MDLTFDETVAELDEMSGRFVVAWLQSLGEDREQLVALGTVSGRLRRAEDAPTPPGAVLFTIGAVADELNG